MCLFQKHLVESWTNSPTIPSPTSQARAVEQVSHTGILCWCPTQPSKQLWRAGCGPLRKPHLIHSFNSFSKQNKKYSILLLSCPAHACLHFRMFLYIYRAHHTIVKNRDVALVSSVHVVVILHMGVPNLWMGPLHFNKTLKGKLCLCPTRAAAFQLKWQLTSDWLKPATL